ncbi:MAG TPA: DUF1365 domain-containing protein [Spongiibacteraceae bacterium]|nr:DUF1365 domain-containing protein [Spongiibacteraceae bacterium]
MPDNTETTKPRLFFGRVRHTRLRPMLHQFAYPVFYVQLPLRHLNAAANIVFSIDRFNLLQFNRCDHGPRDGSELLPWIENLLRERDLPYDGEIILQCFPRVLGYVFNPASFWLCHDRNNALVAILVEVRNTFGGHHCYLIHNPDGQPLREDQTFLVKKQFHVSPFFNVEGTYQFRFQIDRTINSILIEYSDEAGKLLMASISGKPALWSSTALFSALLKMPLLTFAVTLRIHWQAIKLWIKGAPFYGAKPPSPTSLPIRTTSKEHSTST